MRHKYTSLYCINKTYQELVFTLVNIAYTFASISKLSQGLYRLHHFLVNSLIDVISFALNCHLIKISHLLVSCLLMMNMNLHFSGGH